MSKLTPEEKESKLTEKRKKFFNQTEEERLLESQERNEKRKEKNSLLTEEQKSVKRSRILGRLISHYENIIVPEKLERQLEGDEILAIHLAKEEARLLED